MPNIAQVLKEEIARISRKEAKSAVAPIKKPAGKYRSDIAGLKKQVAVLQKELKQLKDQVTKVVATIPAPVEVADQGKVRILGKGVKTLRKKLGLTLAEFAKLTGVTTGAVVLWEKKPGKLKLRGVTKAAILALKGIGKKEARAKLDGMVDKQVVGKGKIR